MGMSTDSHAEYTNGGMVMQTASESNPVQGDRKDKNDNNGTCTSYKVYPSRWFMLLVVCLLNLSNAMMWITFAATADTTIAFYNISSLQLNMLSMVFLIATVPLGFVSTWVLDTFGLRTGLILSAWLNGIGGLLRNVSTLDIIPDDHRYTVLLIGQILAACAQPFVMFTPTKLAALWFAENRRATTNMIGSMMNPFGNLVAFIIVPILVEDASDIPLMLWVVSGPAYLLLVLTTFGVWRSEPPTPPSVSAAQTSEPFIQGLKKIIRNKDYMVLNLCFGSGLALFTSLASFLEQILCPRGYSDEFAGICGALLIFMGAIVSAIAGIYVDRTKNFDEVIKISFALAVLAGIAFTQVSRLSDQHVWIAITIGLFGGFGLAIYPISMELAVEVTYPVAEATSSGLCIVSGQLQGIIYMLSMQALATPLSEDQDILNSGCHISPQNTTSAFIPRDWTYSNLYIFNIFSTAAVIFLVLFFKPTYRRLEAENKALKAENKHPTSSIAMISYNQEAPSPT